MLYNSLYSIWTFISSLRNTKKSALWGTTIQPNLENNYKHFHPNLFIRFIIIIRVTHTHTLHTFHSPSLFMTVLENWSFHRFFFALFFLSLNVSNNFIYTICAIFFSPKSSLQSKDRTKLQLFMKVLKWNRWWKKLSNWNKPSQLYFKNYSFSIWFSSFTQFQLNLCSKRLE